MIWSVNENLNVQIETANGRAKQQLERIFDGRLEHEQIEKTLSCQITVVDSLISAPDDFPFFVDERLGPPTTLGNVSAHGQAGTLKELTLYFNGLAETMFEEKGCRITLSTSVWGTGKFEDIVFTSLAPLLRRSGLFLLHAFGARNIHDGRIALLVGRSGSGKTTTGLTLLHHGWRLLGNDILLLSFRGEKVWVWPTPGLVTIRRPTFDLIPELQVFGEDVSQGLDLTSTQVGQWGEPGPISSIYFPQIYASPLTEKKAISMAVALARLMEESVDRWDKSTAADHIACLKGAVEAAALFTLRLGQNMSQIPDII